MREVIPRPFRAGVDLGGSKAAAVRIRPDRTIDARAVVATGRGAMPAETALIAALEQVWSDTIGSIGVGVAGLVARSGILRWAPHLTETDLDIGRAVHDRFGVPVTVDNDANAAALAEFTSGAGRGYADGMLVTVGTGIGGGIVAGGTVHRGGGFAGEIGHIVTNPGGNLCACGRRGCWETVVSGPALARAASAEMARDPDGKLRARLGPGPVTSEAVVAAARDGDPFAEELLAEMGAALGTGLADLAAVLDPAIIIIGGGLGSIGEPLLRPARMAFTTARYAAGRRPEPPIVVAAHGVWAGAIGAALLPDGEMRT